jgi:hypothetical protein
MAIRRKLCRAGLRSIGVFQCRKVEMQDMLREHVQPHWQGDAVGEALFADIESRDAGSIRATQKCGFKPTGFEGEIEDLHGMAVLVHHYLERPEA